MSHPSQIFQADNTEQDVFQLQSQIEELKQQNNELIYQNIKFKKRIEGLEQVNTINGIQSKQLYNLSKAYIRLGLMTINKQKQYANQEEKIQLTQAITQEHNEIDLNNPQSQASSKEWQLKLKKLRDQLNQKQTCLQAKQIQNKNLIQKIESLKQQYQNVYHARIQQLTKKLQEMKQQQKNIDYLLHNQRLINENKIKIIEKRQQMIKKAEEKMLVRQKQQTQIAQQSVLRMQNLKLDLEHQYAKKHQELQLLYNKKLSSLKDYSQLQDENEALKLQIQALIKEKGIYIEKMRIKTKALQQYKNQLEYRQGIYQSEDIDHFIVEIYESKLQQFSKTLHEISSDSIQQIMQKKKEQLIERLKKNLNKSISRSIKK